MKDWQGLERFAEDRLRRMEEDGARYHPDTSEDWSGAVTISTDGQARKRSRRDLEGERIGTWLVTLLQAQLNQGKSSLAKATLERIRREADASSLRSAEQLVQPQ